MAKRAADTLDDRFAERRPVDLATTLATQDMVVAASILDLSTGGFSARLDEALAIGSRVRLSGSSLGSVTAQVVWHSDGEHGFRFDRPIAAELVRSADRASAVLWVDFTTKTLIASPVPEPVVEKYPSRVRLAIIAVGAAGTWAGLVIAAKAVFGA